MAKHATFLASLLLLAACATTDQQRQARKSTPDNSYDCNYEQTIGSNIQRVVCRSEEQEKEERAQSEQKMRELQMTPQPVQK